MNRCRWSIRPQGRRFGVAALAVVALAGGQAQASAVTCRVEPMRSVLTADSSETMMVKVSLKGGSVPAASRAPINLCLVLDRSGSMQGDRIARAKEAAIAAVERLTPEDIVSVVIFDQQIETIVPAQFVRNKPSIVSAIRAVQSRGSTAIFGAMAQAAAEIRKNTSREYLNRIILLSDGQANVGPAQPGDFGRLGVSLMKEGISVSTVGVGLDFNEDLMTSLSGKSDGNSYFVENSDDLPRIFSSELGSALNVAARGLSLRIEFAAGTTPLEIVGREGTINGATVTLDFNQLYGGQEKYVLIRTAFSPGKDETTRHVATADVKYVDAASSRSERLTATGSVRFSKSQEIVRSSMNTDILRDAELTEDAIATEKAIRLVDEGKGKEAAKIFEAQRRRLEDVAKMHPSIAPAAKSRADAQYMNFDRAASGSFDSRARKTEVQDMYMRANQQVP
ncbi:MAG: VWA domain-containing protein [Kiritimatiellaeota bacterium]|nr:VWA domain-containing protein [Kiritimatiellota bacterium]